MMKIDSDQAMVEVRDLVKTYRKAGESEVRVLRGISFSLQRGEYVALMAPSGTGKTTLINILGCLDRPTSGTYRLEGIRIEDLGDDELSRIRNRKIGFVFQTFHLLPRLTALENVELPLLYSPEAANSRERARECLRAVGLGDRLDYRPHELSGGQQQRVAIARAIVNDPSLILADEPTGNLDAHTAEEILALFSQLHRQGRTIVMVTHDQAVASRAARTIRLREGQIVPEDGS
jgi:putative ABC transport system ATP-binding protein